MLIMMEALADMCETVPRRGILSRPGANNYDISSCVCQWLLITIHAFVWGVLSPQRTTSNLSPFHVLFSNKS